jgi:hypothetical protein
MPRSRSGRPSALEPRAKEDNSTHSSRIELAGVAFAISAGFVVAVWNEDLFPPAYLLRPLVVVGVMSIIVGLLASFFRFHSHMIAAALSALLVRPGEWVTLGLVLVMAFVVAAQIRGRRFGSRAAVSIFAAVFLLSGVVQASTHRVPAPPRTPWDAEVPTYVVLLDGYPRADNLSEWGVDVSDFIAELEERGFDHYSNAESSSVWTHHALSRLFGGESPATDEFGTVDDVREAAGEWSLPEGWVVIPPPIGHVTIPHRRAIAPLVITDLEINLLGGSLPGRLTSGLVMDGLRAHLAESLEALASTEETLVFAHLISPHPPFLYNEGGVPAEAPKCWPECLIFEVNPEFELSPTEWIRRAAPDIAHLNAQILSAVDSIIAKNPDARIVLFSDHGGRFDPTDQDEWRQAFLAARTPDKPRLFGNKPLVDTLFTDLGE